MATDLLNAVTLANLAYNIDSASLGCAPTHLSQKRGRALVFVPDGWGCGWEAGCIGVTQKRTAADL